MLSTAQFATIGHLTVGPATNVDSRVEVCMEGESTPQANKLVLSLSVPLVDMSAGRAFSAGVARIDSYNRHTHHLGFVFDEASKLGERPTAQNGTLLFPNRYPVVDALQLFQGDSALGAFGFSSDLLQDAVIHVRSKASFFATELLELPSGAARALLLQFRAQRTSAIANLVDLPSRQLLAIGGGGDGFDAEINPRKVLCHAWLRGRNFARRSHVELAFVVDQVRLAMLGLQQFFLALPGRIGDLEPSRCGPDAHPIRLECQDAGIVADGTLPGKAWLGFLVQFISVGNLSQDVYGYLSTQREQFFRLVVKQLMERELRENLTAPGVFAHPVAAGVCLLHRLQQCLALSASAFSRIFAVSFNTRSIPQKGCEYRSRFARRAIPPRPEGRSISRK